MCDETYSANSFDYFSNEFKYIHVKFNSNDLCNWKHCLTDNTRRWRCCWSVKVQRVWTCSVAVILKSYCLIALGPRYKVRAWRFEIIWLCCRWKKKAAEYCFPFTSFIFCISFYYFTEGSSDTFSKMDKLSIRYYQYFIGFVGYFGWLFSMWICNLIITIGLVMVILRTFVKYYFFIHFVY